MAAVLSKKAFANRRRIGADFARAIQEKHYGRRGDDRVRRIGTGYGYEAAGDSTAMEPTPTQTYIDHSMRKQRRDRVGHSA